MGDNSAYAGIEQVRSEIFHMGRNNCYGTNPGNIYDEATYCTPRKVTKKENSTGPKRSFCSVIIVICVIILTLGILGACTFFALEIVGIKADIIASLPQDSTLDEQALNASLHSLYQRVKSYHGILEMIPWMSRI